MKLAPASLRFAAVLSSLALGACAGGSGSGTGGQGGTASGGKGGTTGDGGSTGTGGTGTGGSSTGGSTGSGGNVGSGGNSSGGSIGTGGGSGGVTGSGGTGTGGTGTGGTGTGGAGTGGSAGSTGTGGGSGGSSGFVPYVCPSGPFTNPTPSSLKPTRVAGVPIADATINQGGYGFSNIEGPVWIGDALYISEYTNATTPPIPGHILKITASGTVSEAIANSGSNGLAVDANGNIVSANHNAGGIVSFALPSGTPTTLINSYMGTRFNSPNDLAIHTNGTIYFSDPNYQNTSNPQTAQRLYRVAPGSTTAVVIDAGLNQPNGVTLSLDQTKLYVTDHTGIHQYAVAADGSISGSGTAFAASAVNNGDGMAIDCAGNLYVAVPSTGNVVVVSSSGASLGTITVTGVGAVTNCAFGGTDHKTLYITAQGSGGAPPTGSVGGSAQGLYEVSMPLPGMPY
ncbi:MAG TPA: SMP-30/gluconolactonase/LRE family protein [Polyangia bacterium]|nr:SMP-30/gluconolactonase/LRE family protein [Polyangia bacterium]